MRSNPAHRTTALHVACSLTVVALVAGCGAQPRVTAQQESSSYLSRAGRSYTPPGPASDPWGPYVSEASTRFDVPQRWIREVMRQESGGRLYGRNGQLVTSGAGAMGLMQVMPGTYDELRSRYPDLGDDPYDPHNNILAGTAYLREMYDIYGSPGFLAAYNAGPGRLDDYLTRSRTLPDETRRYVANIGARLGSDSPNRPSPGEQYAATAVPLSIPSASRSMMAAAAPIRSPTYSSAVASALNSASPNAPDAPDAPIQLAAAAPPPFAPVQVAQVQVAQVQVAPVQVARVRPAAPAYSAALASAVGTSDAEPAWSPGAPIRLAPQPQADAAFAPDPEPASPRLPEPVQVAELPPAAPRPYAAPAYASSPRPAPVQVAAAPRLPEPPTPPQRPVQTAQVMQLPRPPAYVRPAYATPEPPRQFAAAVPFGPAPRPLAFSLVSRAHAEPVSPRTSGPATGGWAVQVGAFNNEAVASAATQSARGQAREVLAYARTSIAGVRQPGGVLYRARLTGLSRDAATQACERLQRTRTRCLVVSPDAQS